MLGIASAVALGCIDFGDLPPGARDVFVAAPAPGPVASSDVVGGGGRTRGDGGAAAVECGDKTVEMYKVKFRPSELTVCVGDTVTFVNKDLVVHNVLEGVPEGGDHAFKSPKLGTGETWSVTFESPGAVTIYCGTHKKKMRDFLVTVQ